METYLTLLYVTLEQEVALKEYFMSKGWTYSKPDLNVMTDRVGPFDNPQAFKTKSGIMSTLTSNKRSRSIKAKNLTISDQRTERNEPSDKIKLAVFTEGDAYLSQLDDYQDIEESPENDDGDNDDDYADDFNNKTEEIKESMTTGDLSPWKHDRPVTLCRNVENLTIDAIPEEISEAEDEGRLVPTIGRKRRKIAAKAEDTIKTVISQGKGEKDTMDKHKLRQLLAEALKSSKSGKESCKTDFAVCPQCRKAIRNTNLRRHLVTHLGLPHRCTRCSGYFKSQDELEKHRLQKHVGEFICTYCGVKYRFKNSLTEHIQTRHEGTAKMYQCTVCGVKMCRKSHMDDHMNIHNNINPYGCQNCSKSYKNKSAYKRHTKDCGSEIRYVCNECGQIYKSSTGLQDHIKRCHDETNIYLYPCSCGTSYKSRAARCRHRIHCEMYQSEKNAPQPDLVEQNIKILNVTSSSNEQSCYGGKVVKSAASKK